MAESEDEEQEIYECPICDEEFDTESGLSIHEGQMHPNKQIDELEELVDTFEEETDKALDIKKEKESL